MRFLTHSLFRSVVADSSLFTLGGEFRLHTRERTFLDAYFIERKQHMRLFFMAACCINILFFLNDIRFFGQPHFLTAITARTFLVVTSLICFIITQYINNTKQLNNIGIIWGIPCIIASAILVTPNSETSFFIIFVLPIIFYLALPISFKWTVTLGIFCSLITVFFHITYSPPTTTNLGLCLGMLTSNVVLILVLRRANKLQRKEWAAITSAHIANRELSKNKKMIDGILQSIPAPVVIIEHSTNKILKFNDAALQFLGDTICNDKHAINSYFNKHDFAKIARQLQKDRHSAEQETRLTFPNGTIRDILLVATRSDINGVALILTVIIDITNRKAKEEVLQELASTDPLTGLANRSHFFSQAQAILERSRKRNISLSVVMFDIDFFKHINDTFGHKAGDDMLRTCADICRSVIRRDDIVARIGGEEFALLLPKTTMEEAKFLAERLRIAVEQHLDAARQEIRITISLGITTVLPGETGIEKALARADTAMYEAKKGGRNRTVLYDAAMEIDVSARELVR